MSELTAVGIDPGPATGIFFLHRQPARSRAIQCDALTVPVILDMMLARYTIVSGTPCGIEEFRKGARMLKGVYGEVTRDLVVITRDICDAAGLAVAVRPAAAVKPWATDQRLERAGLLNLTGHGMVHARDAARHALYAAVKAGRMGDPLSRDPLRVTSRTD